MDSSKLNLILDLIKLYRLIPKISQSFQVTSCVVEFEEAAHAGKREVVGQLRGEPVHPEEAGRHAAGVRQQLVVGGHDVGVIVPASDGRVGSHGNSGVDPKSL